MALMPVEEARDRILKGVKPLPPSPWRWTRRWAACWPPL
jgi:hypothetical protein